MKDKALGILKHNQLSVTESRRTILNVFLDHTKGAVKHADIEREVPGLDRVTIYRTLQTFTDKGIIHSIPGTDGSVRYALCQGGCEEGHHHDDHIHFICSSCQTTQCLDEVHVPPVSLPRGFKAQQVEMVVTGICGTCRKAK